MHTGPVLERPSAVIVLMGLKHWKSYQKSAFILFFS